VSIFRPERQTKDDVTINELASKTGRSKDFLRRELDKLVDAEQLTSFEGIANTGRTTTIYRRIKGKKVDFSVLQAPPKKKK